MRAAAPGPTQILGDATLSSHQLQGVGRQIFYGLRQAVQVA